MEIIGGMLGQSGKVDVIIDGQFGSTGKGLLAGFLADQFDHKYNFAVTNNGPNSGHTAVVDGRKYVCKQLPIFSAITGKMAYLSAGSIINPEVLRREIQEHGCGVEIHPNAVVVHPNDIDIEQRMLGGIASTQQGTGSALARKVMRSTGTAAQEFDSTMISSRDSVARRLDNNESAVYEVPQGIDLSFNSRFYPYTTSRDISVSSALADAGLHPDYLGKVIMTCRTYPIRVGAVPDNPNSYSGDVYPDQREVTWEQIGVEPERTTVTGRIRRVFTWSRSQFVNSVRIARPRIIFLNFCNYMKPDELDALVDTMISDYAAIMRRLPQIIYGYGPTTKDLHHVRPS